MAQLTLEPRNPFTIWLWPAMAQGEVWDSSSPLGSFKAAVAPITPGNMVQLVDTASELTWINHVSGALEQGEFFVAVERQFMNAHPTDDAAAIDVDYAIGDTVATRPVNVGDSFLARVDTGADIALAQRLQFGADGFLAVAASILPTANVAFFRALESTGGAVAAPTRIRVVRFH